MENIATVMQVIQEVSGVAELQPDQDFYEAGVASVQALPLLLELESKFDVTIPDDRFISARTPRALTEIISGLREA